MQQAFRVWESAINIKTQNSHATKSQSHRRPIRKAATQVNVTH